MSLNFTINYLHFILVTINSQNKTLKNELVEYNKVHVGEL